MKYLQLLMSFRSHRFFDVFEYNALEKHWGCFLCNHPDRAHNFVQVMNMIPYIVSEKTIYILLPLCSRRWCRFSCFYYFQEQVPVIEGQLKEKKGGKWKIFKKWKSRYFTLSGAKLSYKESVSYIIFENVDLFILL